MKHFLLGAFLLLVIQLKAQELFFKAPNSFQNLSSSETYQVLQDSKGILWICTDAGICRYNGGTLKTFTTKDGIIENVVLKIYEDKKGRIWFTTLSGYFFYYYDNKFVNITANDYLKKKSAPSFVASFYVGDKDTLFCTLLSKAKIYKIPPQHNYGVVIESPVVTCDRFLLIDKKNPENSLTGIGKMPVSITDPVTSFLTYNKLFSLPINKNNDLTGNFWRCKSDKFGNIFIPTGKQLGIVNSKENIIRQYNLPERIICVHTDKDSNLWVGMFKDGGLFFRHSNLNAAPVHFLPHLSVSSIMTDEEGTVWATTLEKGVFQCVNKNLIYIAGEDKAMHLQKDSTELNVTYFSKRVISVLKNDSIIIQDAFKSELLPATDLLSSFFTKEYDYFGTNLGLVIKQNDKSIPLYPLKKILSTQILTIGKDSIMAVTLGGFSIIVKGIEKKAVQASFPVLFTKQLRNKKIIFCSRSNNGLYEFKNEALVSYLPELKELKVRINCIAEDAFDNLWIATNEHGLYCYDHMHTLHHFNKTQLDDKINALTIDSKNRLWAATNNGLNKIIFTKTLNKLDIIHFNKSNGLPDEQIKTLESFNGKITCISKEYFFYFDEERLTKNNTPPLCRIDSIFINDLAFNPDHEACLNYDKNNIRILASLTTYKNSRREFFYRLTGYDKSWHYSTDGEIQYTNLPPGNYTLYVYGLNNDKIKSKSPALFKFTVNTPFWLAWWFILLECFISLISIYCILKFWKNKIETRELEKTQMNQRIAEFKMTALRSQMNPHFLFNAIGSIQHYIMKNEPELSYDYLSKFSLLIRNILNNSKEEYISLSQEVNTLKLYIELEQIRFQYPFEFILEIDEALDTEMYIPTMLIQPYVENSIWHGLMPKKSGGKLELLLKKDKVFLLVVIRDNGTGRKNTDSVKKHASKGMSITEQRIQTLESANSKKFTATIIDLKDEQGQSTGTEVNLKIPLDI
ncbi:MAG TPA: two-component regulator propeller domain-containing protein [Bacteroidia bacterium]|jgi:ligand-binding sensor domain-containing protein|nr:two-component regulator propeller domain-containing protein [Bacteroidia bacterium]